MTSVSNGKLPEMKTMAPNSPRLRAKERLHPAMNAGKIAGQMTRANICQLVAPKDRAASSTSVSDVFQHRLHRPDDKRNAGEHHGQRNAERRIGDLYAKRLKILAEPAI